MIPDEYVPPPEPRRKESRRKRMGPRLVDRHRSRLLWIGALIFVAGAGSAAVSLIDSSGIKARVLVNIADTCPDEQGAYAVLKKHYGISGGSRGAVATCQEFARLKPLDAYAHVLLGDACVDTGRIPEAVDSYERALALDSACFEAHLGMGKAQCELGHYPEAIASYERALGLKPDSADAHLALGLALSSAGQCDRAMQSFQRAKQLDPQIAGTQVTTGKTFMQAGMYAQAIECFQDAVQADHAHAQAYFNLGKAYARVGDTALAMEQHRVLQSLDPQLADQLLHFIRK